MNRKLSIKGDLVVTYKKITKKQITLDYDDIKDKILNEIKLNCKKSQAYETNELIILCVKCLLKYNQIANKIDFTEMIKEYFDLSDDYSKWILKNDI